MNRCSVDGLGGIAGGGDVTENRGITIQGVDSVHKSRICTRKKSAGGPDVQVEGSKMPCSPGPGLPFDDEKLKRRITEAINAAHSARRYEVARVLEGKSVDVTTLDRLSLYATAYASSLIERPGPHIAADIELERALIRILNRCWGLRRTNVEVICG
jgi:hypothetical protein